jgi:hypothetical protein
VTDQPRYPVVPIATWGEYRDLVDGPRFREWGFRGQADASWPLLSALSRYLRYSRVHCDAWPSQEARIIRIFQRKAHLFLDHVPDQRDAFQWLALMQHHGAPTRLLDVTWSPYVALFFAIEHGFEKAAVWAFCPVELNKAVRRRGRRREKVPDINVWDHGVFEERFLPNRMQFVTYGEPRVMNRRLIAQSGSFIIPGVLDQPIDTIVGDYENASACLVKIEVDVSKMRDEAMRGLYSMNVTHATLFPDLDGLARSMGYELEYHWGYDPKTLEPRAGHPPPQQLWSWESGEK